jgi:hypothetical protein
MLKTFFLAALTVSLLVVSNPTYAAHNRSLVSPGRVGEPVGEWIVGGGIGLTIDPTLFLISPQLEYVVKPNILVGPLIQLGLGNIVLFVPSVAGRIIIGHHPHAKPSVEGGLGMAIASAGYNSSVGVNIHFGIGFDYQIDPDIAVGTMIRANFAPPLKTFYLSWPIFLGRFLL